MTQLFDLNARIQQLTWSLIFYEKYSTSLSTIVLVVLTTANFGGFSNFCRYYARSQAGKSTGYRPTLKPLICKFDCKPQRRYLVSHVNTILYLYIQNSDVSETDIHCLYMYMYLITAKYNNRLSRQEVPISISLSPGNGNFHALIMWWSLSVICGRTVDRYDNVTLSPLLPRWSKSGLRVTLSYLHVDGGVELNIITQSPTLFHLMTNVHILIIACGSLTTPLSMWYKPFIEWYSEYLQHLLLVKHSIL